MNLVIEDLRPIGPFDYRWPDSGERFERGFEATARADDATFAVRHGIGARHVYGRQRVHTVTWIAGQPIVEGVAADDFEESDGLVSAIRKVDKTLVRSADDLPSGYDRFDIVHHDAEIVAPYTRKALAVKIRSDDVASWAALALLRLRAGGDRGGRDRPATPTEPETRPVPAALEDVAVVTDRRAVAAGLLRYAQSYAHREGEPLPPLTPDLEADRLVKEDPFAFLLAVIFDQGIPYGRAWRAPLELRRRLGSLEPEALVSDADGVRAAVLQPPHFTAS